MNIGEKLKELRKERGMSAKTLAEKLGVSRTTIYRYEDATIEKIPLHVVEKICSILNVSVAELMGNVPKQDEMDKLPGHFDNARDAMEFIIKTPTLAAYGGYDPNSMDDETIVQFANEILQQIKLVSYKYKNI